MIGVRSIAVSPTSRIASAEPMVHVRSLTKHFALRRGWAATLLVVAHVPFGLVAASCVLVFRNMTPLPSAVFAASTLLGGVYYPAHIIPSWLQYVSGAIPMTYGLRAFRATLLEGAPLHQVAGDVAILGLFAAVLLPLGIVALRLGLRYARTTGSLTHY
jgi:ABC-2 type transport system permease protein